MKFHFLTIFPEMIEGYMNESILKRAGEKKLLSFEVKNIREFSKDKHRKTDERPYGGGPGMVMTAEPILNTFGKLKLKKGGKMKVIQLSPSGKMFTNDVAKKMAKTYSDIVFICGRYEGVDDRVRKILKADEYSVGDYTVTGGELPALIMTDAIARQIPGVLGKGESLEESRIASPRTYTRPEILVYKGKKYKVPKVLTTGDHKKIDAWRESQQKV
ncbi:tRNA (guanosine(37)-N1)-methyltransferase TrmD [Candidatus Woesebacteria bacterium]|nr:tRNA (guanosine(37)-N1)-methyltransferase TrmD [Candidatus Paceibacterota bacterium]MBP7967490.1 tRNA (guanosine(37)-N1)-methyltransferase TrmD [Candidatus Woesebacteria bacterium]